MQLGTLVGPDAVKVINACSSKKRLFHELGELAAGCYGVDAGAVVDALIDRESLGPTGVGHGVALPHARLDGLNHVVGLFMMVEKPLDFDAVDKQPVDLVFALLAPTEAGVDHLKALALVSRTLRDQSICQKLRANSDATTLHMILTEACPSNKAA